MDHSETSNTEDLSDISEVERNVKIFATQMLKSRIFSGQFQERRYVEPISGYRDVIVVNDNEHDLKKDIDIVRKRLRGHFGNEYWIGLTQPDFIGAPRGYCIWVESEVNPLGHYWYKIRGVTFRRNEIILRVKVLRAITDNDDSTQNQNLSFESNIAHFLEDFSWDATLENIKNTFFEYFIWIFTTVLTANNIKQTITCLSLIIATSLALSVKAIAFLMDFSLKFMRESSYFVQSATPVMISVVNLVGKVIGGFYLLILSIWRDSRQPAPIKRNYQAIEYPRMSRFTNRPSLTITEVE